MQHWKWPILHQEVRAEHRSAAVTMATGGSGTSSEAGQTGRSFALLHTAFQRQGAGQRVLALLPRPAVLAVAPAAVTLAVTWREDGRRGCGRQRSERKWWVCTRYDLNNSEVSTTRWWERLWSQRDWCERRRGGEREVKFFLGLK